VQVARKEVQLQEVGGIQVHNSNRGLWILRVLCTTRSVLDISITPHTKGMKGQRWYTGRRVLDISITPHKVRKRHMEGDFFIGDKWKVSRRRCIPSITPEIRGRRGKPSISPKIR
jgi:hypothetical protein